ncbi:hypothetical protein GCM10029992_04170 [Glycomyces albus]
MTTAMRSARLNRPYVQGMSVYQPVGKPRPVEVRNSRRETLVQGVGVVDDLGPLLEGEAAGVDRGPLGQVGQLADLDLAGVADLLVLDEDDVELPVRGGDGLDDAVDGPGPQLVVGVDEPHVVAGGLGQPEVAGRSGAGVLRGRDDAQARIGGRVAIGDRARTVGRAVVGDDDLEPVPAAAEDAVQASSEVFLGFVDGDDDAQSGHVAILSP